MAQLELYPVGNQKSFYGKARVILSFDNTVTLKSYNTLVCRYNADGTFSRLWSGYSATTMRHVNSFRSIEGARMHSLDTSPLSKTEWDKLPVEN